MLHRVTWCGWTWGKSNKGQINWPTLQGRNRTGKYTGRHDNIVIKSPIDDSWLNSPFSYSDMYDGQDSSDGMVMDAGMILRNCGGCRRVNQVAAVWTSLLGMHGMGLATVVQRISRECIPCLCPSCEIRVTVCIEVVLNITCSRMTWGITSHPIWHGISLVHSNVIDVHLAGELQMFPILLLESGWQTQIEEKVHWFFRY